MGPYFELWDKVAYDALMLASRKACGKCRLLNSRNYFLSAMTTTSLQHTTVLLDEAVDALITDADAMYVDATFGRGGHSKLILSKLSPKGAIGGF